MYAADVWAWQSISIYGCMCIKREGIAVYAAALLNFSSLVTIAGGWFRCSLRSMIGHAVILRRVGVAWNGYIYVYVLSAFLLTFCHKTASSVNIAYIFGAVWVSSMGSHAYYEVVLRTILL